MFLSDRELKELTGYSAHAWQRRWLDKNNWRYEVSASGRPVVMKSYAASRLSGVPEVSGNTSIRLNFDALKRRA